MYLDESGNHDLKKIDPNYPLFVLGGVIVDESYATTVMEEEVNQFKMSWFGSTSPVLHTADITRNRFEFEILKDGETRKRFLEGLNALMRRLEYTVVSAVVRKHRLRGRFYRRLDLYSLSFEFLLEVFMMSYIVRADLVGSLRNGANRNLTIGSTTTGIGI